MLSPDLHFRKTTLVILWRMEYEGVASREWRVAGMCRKRRGAGGRQWGRNETSCESVAAVPARNSEGLNHSSGGVCHSFVKCKMTLRH